MTRRTAASSTEAESEKTRVSEPEGKRMTEAKKIERLKEKVNDRGKAGKRQRDGEMCICTVQ